MKDNPPLVNRMRGLILLAWRARVEHMADFDLRRARDAVAPIVHTFRNAIVRAVGSSSEVDGQRAENRVNVVLTRTERRLFLFGGVVRTTVQPLRPGQRAGRLREGGSVAARPSVHTWMGACASVKKFC